MRRRVLVSLVAFLLIPAAQAQPAAQTPAYHVVQTVPLGAPDRWDYLVYDRPSHRLYVSHGDTLSVLDGQSGAMIGTVTGVTGGTHGIGIAAATGKGYTVDGAAGQAVAFDLKTFKTGAHMKADADADGIAFDPSSGHVFVVDGDPGKLTVVDPKTDSVIANIDLGGKLEYAVSGENGKVYVNGEANKEIVRVDTVSNKVDAHWANPGCTSPHGLAIDTANHRLFISCANAVMTVMNADSGAVLATLPIGQGSDGAAFDPGRKLAFASNNDGSVSVIREVDARTFVPAGSIKTPVTGKNMTINPDTGRLYVAVADIDPNAAVAPGPGGRPGRPRPLPGSLKILFIDP